MRSDDEVSLRSTIGTMSVDHERHADECSLVVNSVLPSASALLATVVAPGAEFDASVEDAEIEPVDAAPVAALLAEIPHARPRPFAKAMTRQTTRAAMTCATPSPARRGGAIAAAREFQTKPETRDAESPGRCAVNDYAQE
jgi:hypothetical protein